MKFVVRDDENFHMPDIDLTVRNFEELFGGSPYLIVQTITTFSL